MTLDAQAKKFKAAVKKALTDQGTYEPHDEHLTEMLAQCEGEIRALRTAIGDNWVLEAGGSRNQPVAHPLIKPLHEAEKHFISYARELKFTPATRGDTERKPASGGKFDL